MARHVFWWKPAEVTLSDDAVFLCPAMVLGRWDDFCFLLDRYDKAPFAKPCGRRLEGFSATTRGHYWHHRLQLLPIPELPRCVIPA
jgi:hypothetical protein